MNEQDSFFERTEQHPLLPLRQQGPCREQNRASEEYRYRSCGIYARIDSPLTQGQEAHRVRFVRQRGNRLGVPMIVKGTCDISLTRAELVEMLAKLYLLDGGYSSLDPIPSSEIAKLVVKKCSPRRTCGRIHPLAHGAAVAQALQPARKGIGYAYFHGTLSPCRCRSR